MNRPPGHIAVVRFSAMGDVAMLFPVLRAVMAQNDLEITLITRPQFAPIFSAIPGLKVKTVDLKNHYRGLAGLWQLAREIKALGPDYCLDLHDVLRTKIVSAYLRLLGVPVAKFDKGRTEKTQRVKNFDPRAPWLKSTHERYADGFRALGLKVTLKQEASKQEASFTTISDTPFQGKSSDNRGPEKKPETLLVGQQGNFDRSSDVQVFLNSLGTTKGALIGFAPFAAYPGKTYPLDLAKQLCLELTQNHHRVLLFGAPGMEAEQLSVIAQEISGVVTIAGQWTFEQELEIMSALDLMIAMDSGNGHLAANYGVPVITLWGATHPSLGFTPFGQGPERQLYADRQQYPETPTSVYGNKLPQGYGDLMRSISVAQISAKVEEVLG